MPNQFVGAWRLAWTELIDSSGKVHRADRTGMLIYAPDGHMSVQIVEDHTAGAPVSGPITYSQGGYEAYFGSYGVDRAAHTVTRDVEGSLVPTLIGSDLTRAYRFSERQLILRSSRTDEHWTVAWERY
jgi:hypothetical protein